MQPEVDPIIDTLRLEFQVAFWRGRSNRFRRLFIGAAWIGAMLGVVAVTEALVWWAR